MLLSWVTVSDDFNGDGHKDLFLAGNLHVSEVETPRADGGTGKVLLGNGDGTFRVAGIKEAGIYAARDVRNVALLSTGKGKPGNDRYSKQQQWSSVVPAEQKAR